jgi:acetyltransferase-like isoleucine patch superfamily enzyme
MIVIYIYKAIKRIFRYFRKISWIITYFKFKLNGVNISTDFKSNGIPLINISLDGRVSIGRKFEMNNGLYNNMIGRQQPCFFIVYKKGELIVGNNVGISATAIVCWNKIVIEDGVRIGGGTVIYDTDFHSLDYQERTEMPEIKTNIRTSPVLIKKNAFIGANSTILKGVEIGERSIIGACSVVTRSVPSDEVWAGNPAKFIRKIIN